MYKDKRVNSTKNKILNMYMPSNTISIVDKITKENQ